MPVNIVYDYPCEHRLRRFLSTLIRLLGACLLAFGLLAAVPVLFFLIIVIPSVIAGEPSGFDRDGFIGYSELAIIMLVCLILGRWLLRGRRRLVLFLRRFGFVGATEVLTFALANAIGSSWRLITLDDRQVSAVGVGGKIRWTTVAGAILSVVIPAAALLWFFNGGYEYLMNGKQNITESGLAGLLNLIGLLTIVFIFFLSIILLLLLFLLLGLFSLGSYISVRRAERSKTIAVSAPEQIDSVASSVARRVRRVISPRLVVVRVADSVWQDTVRRLALLSAAIVIDISEPTQNLFWEVTTLKPELRLHWILVAEQQRLNRWTTELAVNTELNRKLLDILDGETVLAYSVERSDRKRFARALRNRLDAVPRSDIG